jgi:hypothetical protein
VSTTTIPFSARFGFFPFIIGAAPSPNASLYDSIDLTPVSTDAGLREAMRIYYMLERLEIIPSGSSTETATSETQSFVSSFITPLPDTSILKAGTFFFQGILTGSRTTIVNSTSQPSAQPAFRVIGTSSGSIPNALEILRSGAANEEVISDPNPEIFSVDLRLGFDGSVWKLYYRFELTRFGLQIANPARVASMSGGAPNASGTSSLLGYSLDWQSFVRDGFTATGEGLSMNATEWTF